MDGIQQRSLNAIIAIVPTWYKEVQETYKNDLLYKKILVEKLVNPYSWPQYALLEWILRFKRKVVICLEEDLRNIIVLAINDSYLNSHVGIQNSYKRVNSLFCWLYKKKIVKQVIEEYDICKQAKLERNVYWYEPSQV